MVDVVRVASAGEIGEGEVKAYQVGDTWVGVTRSEGTLYAFEDECTHAHCPLSRGLVERGQIECDCHGALFDLRTGAVTKPPATKPITIYEVKQDGGDVLVAVNP
jgi:3-phenylpropionate/trans-cinnamate dioxygenase ferredoxin subunit